MFHVKHGAGAGEGDGNISGGYIPKGRGGQVGMGGLADFSRWRRRLPDFTIPRICQVSAPFQILPGLSSSDLPGFTRWVLPRIFQILPGEA